MYGVELIRSVCKEKKVPIARLERELGYANGYLNPKLKKIPYDRAVQIAKYLDIDVNQILGVEPSPAPEDHEGLKPYYINPETAQIAQKIFEDKDLRALFDAAVDSDPEDLQTVHTMLTALKKKERGDGEPC